VNRPADGRGARDWVRLGRLFARCSTRPPAAREALLARIGARHPTLLPCLRELLGAHDRLEGTGSDPRESPSFLDRLDSECAAELIRVPDPATRPGAHIGRYTVVRPIGRGGMGVVLLARDPELDREVALKLLPPARAGHADANARLLAEARAASALDHPNVGTVYEIAEAADGRRYIAMAYLAGDTLRDRLRAGPIDRATSIDFAAQIADGLAAAHARGIVHRDIKPENLIVTRDGRVRIVDFGVAALTADGPATSATSTAGTVAYMSPEQTRGSAVDRRTDLWSLGVVLYEMLTGRRPFAGDDRASLVRSIREDDPPEPLHPGLALRPELSPLVRRCLAKAPESRPASAAEIRDELRALLAGASPRPVSPWLAATGYFALSIGVVEGASRFADRYLLPEATVAAVLVLLVAGFPVVLATALGTAGGQARHGSGGALRAAAARLSWPRTLGGGMAAFAALIAISGFVVVSGAPRVTGTSGSFPDALTAGGSVLLTEFDSDDGNAGIAIALREALAVDLQQSGHFTVVGRAQTAGILARMGRDVTERIDLPLALEIAERAGAGAVIDVSVRRLGSDFVLSGRALRPGSGEEMFAVRTAAGESRLLGGVEALSRAIRRRLGESRDAIRRSLPLPEVSTPSIQALRLYAEAERAAARGDLAAASAQVEQALAVDPEFAMAHRLAGALASNTLRFGDARTHLMLAYEHRDRLTERERWHVEGIYHGAVSLEPRRAAEVFAVLLQRFPGDVRAANNLASVLEAWLDSPDEASRYFLRAAEADPPLITALTGAARTAFKSGRPAEADSLAAIAEARGVPGFRYRWAISRGFATGDHSHVARACSALHDGTAGIPILDEDREFCGSADVAAGRLAVALPRLEEAERHFLESRRHRNFVHVAQAAAVAHAMRGEPDLAAARIASAVARLPDDVLPEPDRFLTRVNLQIQAALLRRPDLVLAVGAAYPAREDPDHWLSRLGHSLVAAAEALEAGDGAGSLRTLRAGASVGQRAQGWRIWEELLRGMAFEMIGQPDSAAVRYARAADPRYHVVDYLTKDRIHLPFALHRLARAETARGDTAAAARAEERLRMLLADADPGIRLDVIGW
jgi:eukaryotic-like serine/threonine-protein kinase